LWLTARRDIVDRACAANLFAKAARGRAVAGDGLSDRVERLLCDRCIEVIGMARRAGQAVAGYEKVRRYLRGGKADVVLTACDAADGGRAKVAGLASGVTIVESLRASELGQAFARVRVVHVAIGSHGLAGRLVMESGRLAGFRIPPASGKLD
jgi:ribosomal protein L7Ae-like RNA K-turn-binding protein